MHTEIVEQAGNAQLVADRQRDAFLLGPVPQRCVVDLECHGYSNEKPSAAAKGRGRILVSGMRYSIMMMVAAVNMSAAV